MLEEIFRYFYSKHFSAGNVDRLLNSMFCFNFETFLLIFIKRIPALYDQFTGKLLFYTQYCLLNIKLCRFWDKTNQQSTKREITPSNIVNFLYDSVYDFGLCWYPLLLHWGPELNLVGYFNSTLHSIPADLYVCATSCFIHYISDELRISVIILQIWLSRFSVLKSFLIHILCLCLNSWSHTSILFGQNNLIDVCAKTIFKKNQDFLFENKIFWKKILVSVSSLCNKRMVRMFCSSLINKSLTCFSKMWLQFGLFFCKKKIFTVRSTGTLLCGKSWLQKTRPLFIQ